MRKLKYETPEIRIALTAADIKASDMHDTSFNAGEEVPGIGGVEMPELPED